MNLDDAPFSYMKDGLKKIEVRLYDERRKDIKIGDKILFTNSKLGNFKRIVKKKNLYSTLEELVIKENLSEAGMYRNTDEWVKHIYSIYPKSKIDKYGLVVLHLEIV